MSICRRKHVNMHVHICNMHVEICNIKMVLELLNLHVAEEFAPVALEYVPFGQSVHAPSPTKSLNLPAGQLVQASPSITSVYTRTR